MTMEALKALLTSLARNAVRLEIGTGEGPAIGRFGGAPDVPEGFSWPWFTTDTYMDDEVKPRPLAFLCQFDCAALAELDGDGLPPHEGVLSFFYELGSQRWGYDPKDAGCARVYWFPEKAALGPADFPEALEEEFRLPSLPIRGRMERCFPGYDDAAAAVGRAEGELGLKTFNAAYSTVAGKPETVGSVHRLLGWPDIIQSSMTAECELVSRGYNLGGGQKIPEDQLREAEETSLENWRLLFQLDSIQLGKFSLDFGDYGRVYFYIRKEDLAARRFDRVWLVLQCG